MDLCEAHGIKILPYGVLAGGFLTDTWLGKPAPDPEVSVSRGKGGRKRRRKEREGGREGGGGCSEIDYVFPYTCMYDYVKHVQIL